MSNDKEQRERAADEIRSKLTRHTTHQNEQGVSKDFVTQHDIERLWTSSRLKELFTGLMWADEKFLDAALKPRRKILAILVKIRWNKWEDFKTIFVDNLRAVDTDLPINENRIQILEKALGDTPLAFEFQANQYVFLPIVIQENQDVEYWQDFRWPFTENSETVSSKGSLTVFREVIAPRQFKDVDGGFNAEKKALVRKSCSVTHTNVDIQKEVKNLAKIRECLSQNSRIMNSLGSVLYSNCLHIFFPLADFDLDDFLYDKKHSEQIVRYPVKPIHLIHEVAGLANALDYLHDGLHSPDGEHFICIHHDIKPDNILIFHDPMAPVGRWKITDFGVSRLKKAQSNSDDHVVYPYYHIPSAPASLTIPKRPMGSFQAPEVERQEEKGVGPQSDIWSLGCVLCLVLAYAIGGTSSVNNLDETRKRRKEGMSYEDDYYYRDNPPTLKPEIRTWFHEFCDITEGENSWVKPCTSIITSMMNIDPRNRPSAKWVEKKLYRVVKEIKEPGGDHEESSEPPLSPKPKNLPVESDKPGEPSTTIERPIHPRPDCKSTSAVLKMPSQQIVQTALSLDSGIAVFLSKSAVFVYSIESGEERTLSDQETFLEIPASDGYVWRSMAISGMYLALRGSAVEPGEDTVHLYQLNICGSSKIESDMVFSTSDNQLVAVDVSAQGHIALQSDSSIGLYNPSDYSAVRTVKIEGLIKGSFLTQNGKHLVALTTENRTIRSRCWNVDGLEQHFELTLEKLNGAHEEIASFPEFPWFVAWDKHSGVVSLIQGDIGPPNRSRFHDHLAKIEIGAVTQAGNAIIFLHKVDKSTSTGHQLSLATLGQREDGVISPDAIKRLDSIKLKDPCALALKTLEESGLVQQVMVANLSGEMEVVEFHYH